MFSGKTKQSDEKFGFSLPQNVDWHGAPTLICLQSDFMCAVIALQTTNAV